MSLRSVIHDKSMLRPHTSPIVGPSVLPDGRVECVLSKTWGVGMEGTEDNRPESVQWLLSVEKMMLQLRRWVGYSTMTSVFRFGFYCFKSVSIQGIFRSCFWKWFNQY